jgi:prevent-host-death family protein
MARISATEISRSLSAVLDHLARGEEVEVVRSGQPVARITPARPTAVSAAEFRALMVTGAAAPSVPPQLAPPPGDPWPS